MTKNSFKQVSFPLITNTDPSKLASKAQAITAIIMTSLILITFSLFNFFYKNKMMEWSIKFSESLINYDQTHLKL